MNQLIVFLGVQTDGSCIPTRFEVYLAVTDKRKLKLRDVLKLYVDLRFDEMLKLTHAQASKLFGKTRRQDLCYMPGVRAAGGCGAARAAV